MSPHTPIASVEARADRIEQLRRIVAGYRYGVSLDTICEDLGVTDRTARRYVAVLESEGRVTRSYVDDGARTRLRVRRAA